MRRGVQVSSLAVGKCFTLDLPPGAPDDPKAGEMRRKTPILAPDKAWKVEEVDDDGVKAKSAAGETKTFPGTTKVVEVARQGYDKLAKA
jgi:hypothetical protein